MLNGTQINPRFQIDVKAYPGLKLSEEGACLTVMFASICLRRLFGWISLVLAQWRDTPSVLHPMDTS